MQTNCILITGTSNFVIQPQILIFSVFKIVNLSQYWLQMKFTMLLLLIFAINLWHQKFITADVVIAVFVNNQHHI